MKKLNAATLRDLFARAAGVLGLKRELDCEFPARKLKSFDLQGGGRGVGRGGAPGPGVTATAGTP